MLSKQGKQGELHVKLLFYFTSITTKVLVGFPLIKVCLE